MMIFFMKKHVSVSTETMQTHVNAHLESKVTKIEAAMAFFSDEFEGLQESIHRLREDNASSVDLSSTPQSQQRSHFQHASESGYSVDDIMKTKKAIEDFVLKLNMHILTPDDVARYVSRFAALRPESDRILSELCRQFQRLSGTDQQSVHLSILGELRHVVSALKESVADSIAIMSETASRTRQTISEFSKQTNSMSDAVTDLKLTTQENTASYRLLREEIPELVEKSRASTHRLQCAIDEGEEEKEAFNMAMSSEYNQGKIDEIKGMLGKARQWLQGVQWTHPAHARLIDRIKSRLEDAKELIDELKNSSVPADGLESVEQQYRLLKEAFDRRGRLD